MAVLEPSAVQLKTYTGQLIEMLGTSTVKAEYMGKAADVRIQVAKGDGPNLLGRDWLEPLAVDLARAVHNVQSDSPLQEVLNKHSQVLKYWSSRSTEVVQLSLFELKEETDP